MNMLPLSTFPFPAAELSLARLPFDFERTNGDEDDETSELTLRTKPT